MKLELKQIKYMASLSQETPAYTATLFKDGKPFAHILNNGSGGPDEQRPIAPFTYQDLKAVEDWIGENTPPRPMSNLILNGKPVPPMPEDLESWCMKQLDHYLRGRDLTRVLNKRVLFQHEGKVYQTAKFQAGREERAAEIGFIAERVREQHEGAVILNLIPFAEALAIYEASADQ